jgi:hypothetical protein
MERDNIHSSYTRGERNNPNHCYQGKSEQVRLLPGKCRTSQVVAWEQQNKSGFYQRTSKILPANSRTSYCDRGTTNKSDFHQGIAEKVRWLPRKQSKPACYQGTAEQVCSLPGNSRASLIVTKEQQTKPACYQGTAERVRLLQGNSRTSQIDTKEHQNKLVVDKFFISIFITVQNKCRTS